MSIGGIVEGAWTLREYFLSPSILVDSWGQIAGASGGRVPWCCGGGLRFECSSIKQLVTPLPSVVVLVALLSAKKGDKDKDFSALWNCAVSCRGIWISLGVITTTTTLHLVVILYDGKVLTAEVISCDLTIIL